MKKTLALFLPSLAHGGAERVMLNIAIGLHQRGEFDIDLVLVEASGPYLEQARASGVRIVDLGCSRIISSLPAVVRYLRKTRPVAVLSALDTTNLVMLWAARIARTNTRVIVSEHCNFSHALAGAVTARSRLLPVLVSRFYPWADEIVSVSAGVADDLAQSTAVPRESMTVIVNPVITPEVERAAQAEPEHPWLAEGENVPVVLGIGRLTYQKNFQLLINAFSKLASDTPARLVILGEGEDRDDLEQQVESLGLTNWVDLPGFVQNPYAFMRKASLFALSSRYEGLPTVLIEALFCGAPVVSTDCPSGPREILLDGNIGALVPCENIDALAAAMRETLLNPPRFVDASVLAPYRLAEVADTYAKIMVEGTG